MIEFGDDIAPPSGQTNVEKYGLKNMKVGSYVFVRGQGSGGEAVRTAHSYGQKSKKKFKSRSDDEGVRIWRMS